MSVGSGYDAAACVGSPRHLCCAAPLLYARALLTWLCSCRRRAMGWCCDEGVGVFIERVACGVGCAYGIRLRESVGSSSRGDEVFSFPVPRTTEPLGTARRCLDPATSLPTFTFPHIWLTPEVYSNDTFTLEELQYFIHLLPGYFDHSSQINQRLQFSSTRFEEQNVCR